MMEAEILAVLTGLEAISSHEIRVGKRVANKISIYLDNLEGQRMIASITGEPVGSALLESLAKNCPRIRLYVRMTKELVPLKQVVKLRRDLSANDTSRHPKLLKIGPNHQCQ